MSVSRWRVVALNLVIVEDRERILRQRHITWVMPVYTYSTLT